MAHDYYDLYGPGGARHVSWEAWFSKKLRNRIYYFFHKHGDDGKLVRYWAEWPLVIPPLPKTQKAA